MDFYETPNWQTESLLKRVSINGLICEPCVGDSSIANHFIQENLVTNDINPKWEADYHYDAAQKNDLWLHLQGQDQPDWIVTNPPFNQAMPILKQSFRCARIGVAMLLRLTFLEPTKERSDFLNANPPTRLIVLPRWSYKANRKTDSVTTAWMVWKKECFTVIQIVPVEEKVRGMKDKDCHE